MKTFVNAVVLATVALFFTAPAALADDARLELKKDTTMSQLLTGFMGKRVALMLKSGEQVDGTVKVVGDSLVQISALSGKDFYDAVVPLDKINAVVFRAR